MPKFIDYHEKAPQLPPEVMQQVTQAINSKQADEFGVVPINAFMGTNGESFCMTEAPSADAVCQSHAAKGMTLGKGDVHEVQSLV